MRELSFGHPWVRTVALVLFCAWSLQPSAAAAPAQVYTHPFLQSPVRAEPSDLLMIPGHGFADGAVVVYQSLADTTQPLLPPESVPAISNAAEGICPVVSCTQDRLVCRLPSFMTLGQSYALWVRNPGEDWSDGIRINDARPLWVTPDIVHENEPVASLPRQLKVVGRNLEPAPTAPSGATRVKLIGPETHVLDAVGETNPALEHYVARVDLPATLLPGPYDVEVSRDGIGWVPVRGSLNPLHPSQLTVRSDPQPGQTFQVASFGCAPDDGLDDAACVQQAIDAAAPVDGVVKFGDGQWDFAAVPDTTQAGGISHGIVVPPGVSLEGNGRDVTRVVRTDQWGFVPDCPYPGIPCVAAVFTLQGRNTVSGIHFEDQFPDELEFPFLDEACLDACDGDTSCQAGCRNYRLRFLQLGKLPWWTGEDDPRQIEDVFIVNNRFTNVRIAIQDGGWPLRHIFVTYNQLEAFKDDVFLGGNAYRREVRFNVESSVVAHNDFYPGDYYNPDIAQGVIASQIGAARHVDFSDNVAHRADMAGACASRPTGCGWRAAHFWHMNNNFEGLLVSGNETSCTGDKAGDGEAFGFDNNHNEPAFRSARLVLDATDTTVTVQGPWYRTGSEGTGDLDYYREHWIQVVEGVAIGQGRKIESCCCGTVCSSPEDSACGAACDGPIGITVSPAWDVVPEPGKSWVTGLRAYWQVYVVDNLVDTRGCEKDNPTEPSSGVILYHGNTLDSTIEANRLYESDGIRLSTGYSVESYDPEVGLTFDSWARLQFFTEVRGNTVADEYNFDDCAPPDCPRLCCTQSCCPAGDPLCMNGDYCGDPDCCSEATCCAPKYSWSGLDMMYGQYRVADSPVLGYGVSVSHNSVSHADAMRGGAIAIERGWWPPPTPGHPQYTSVLIQHNDVRDVERRDGGGVCLPYSYGLGDGGIGIHLGEPHTHDSVLYANTIEDVCHPIVEQGTNSLQLADCPEEIECGAVSGCTATGDCSLVDTGVQACLLPDEGVFKCPAFHRVHSRHCPCEGDTCPLHDRHLTCEPVSSLPACPPESACSDGPGCSATSDCFDSDIGIQACVRADGTVLGCSGAETIRIRRCTCQGPACPLNDEQLVCGSDPAPPPGPPGTVPATLSVSRSATTPGALALSWSPSCSGGAEDYGVYEGEIGVWYSHEPIDCTDQDHDFFEQVEPSAGDRYYLVVPSNIDDDGSYGTDSDGEERPAGSLSCRLTQNTAPCP
jgi:hypothetical protein